MACRPAEAESLNLYMFGIFQKKAESFLSTTYLIGKHEKLIKETEENEEGFNRVFN